jgi:hypothetical protein
MKKVNSASQQHNIAGSKLCWAIKWQEFVPWHLYSWRGLCSGSVSSWEHLGREI